MQVWEPLQLQGPGELHLPLFKLNTGTCFVSSVLVEVPGLHLHPRTNIPPPLPCQLQSCEHCGVVVHSRARCCRFAAHDCRPLALPSSDRPPTHDWKPAGALLPLVQV